MNADVYRPGMPVDITPLIGRHPRRIKWLLLIASDREKLRDAIYGTRTFHREHKYIGGPPSKRIKRMQLAHETRARAAGVPWDMVDLRTVYRDANGVCGICHLPVGENEFTIDHIHPISRGGAHILGNLQLAHFACNSSKGDR